MGCIPVRRLEPGELMFNGATAQGVMVMSYAGSIGFVRLEARIADTAERCDFLGIGCNGLQAKSLFAPCGGLQGRGYIIGILRRQGIPVCVID